MLSRKQRSISRPFHSRSGTRGIWFDRRLRLHPLAACLALVFSATAPATAGDTFGGQAMSSGLGGRHATHFTLPSAITSAVTHVVTRCDDPLPVPSTCAETIDGTLRQGLLCGQDGDTIDLTQLQCSKITLSAALITAPVTLALNGPGQEKLTIDAAGTFRALVHKPPHSYNSASFSGLYINNLTITNGRYNNPQNSVYNGHNGSAAGGCIYSTGSVFMNSSTVSSCYTSATVPYSKSAGGAIFALGTVSLADSTVTGSTAFSGGTSSYNGSADAARAYGGGVSASLVELLRSTVSGNTATSKRFAGGGGVYGHTVYCNYSSISGNTATNGGGIRASKAYLAGSTISGNYADFVGGVYANAVAAAFSSTITGNSDSVPIAAGIFTTFGSFTLQSTIVVDNKSGAVELDVGAGGGTTVAGQNNLIGAHADDITVPPDTISGDPKLGPLQDNGGPTRTHALLPGSPAIDKGNSSAFFDQRGSPRVIGNKADIGAFEFDPNHIFGNGFNL